MRDLWQRLSRRTRILLATAAGVVIAYGLFGFFVAPGIVRRDLARQLGATLHRAVTVARVKVNPFALSVAVDTLRVADKDGATLLSWDRFYINFELISILKREFDFAEVRLVHPYGRLVIRPDGTMNISDIVDSLTAGPKPANPAPLPVLAVGALHIDTLRVDLLDSATARPFTSTVGPWQIDLQQFATRRDNSSQYSFSGRTESGESFSWAGTFAIDPLRSAGEFSLDSVRLAKYGPFYERTVGFDVVDGFAGVRAKYSIDLTPRARVMRLMQGALRVDRVAMLVRGLPDTAIELRRLDVTGVEADAVAHQARVGAVTLAGGRVDVIRARDSTINLSKMAATGREVRAAGKGAPAAAPPPAAAPAPPSAPWSWLVARLVADSVTVNVIDSAAGRPARLALSGISAAADTVSSDTNTLTRIRASLAWAPRGTVAATGAIRIWKRQGDLAIKVNDVALAPLDAYLAPRIALFITDGTLTADTRLHFDVRDSLEPDLAFAGDVQADRFATAYGAARTPFFGFRSLRVTGLGYARRPEKLVIKAIALDAPTLELGLSADGTPVTNAVFPRAGADTAAEDTMPADTARHDSAAIAATPARKDSAAPAAPTIRTSIGGIRITNGTIRFTDRSIQPPVAVSIAKIGATTGRLSTDSIGVGTLELTAMIDGVAPLKMTGRFNPLSDKEGSDLTVEMQGMEMVPIGPYFGKYLGYGISTGKMRIGMQYRVLARRLKSENKLTLDGFQFGDATNSPDATKLPVKLAFSIMRDRSGQIVFDVPVEGNLDDPHFRLGRVIGRAIVNVLTKLATSPFKLLGGMFGGGSTADLSYAEFAAGADTLSSAGAKKLDVLAKALYERPALKLEIAGAVDTAADAAGIRTAKLDRQLLLRKWTALKEKDARTPPLDSLSLTPTDRPLWLAAAFEAAFPADSAVVGARKSKTPMPYPPAVMEQRLAATIPVGPEDLQLLASARAKRCLDYLLTVPANKPEAERVLLTGGAMHTDGARADFSLQ